LTLQPFHKGLLQMTKTPLTCVSLAFAATMFSLPNAIAQRAQPPSDTKLMHDVQGVLQNEKAFRGLTIIPKVSHGMVTLTGTVSSEGDKVLAAMEVGNVDGVRTVMNDLDVKAPGAQQTGLPALSNPNGAQTQQLTHEAPQAPAVAASSANALPVQKAITIPANTPIQIRISDALTTKTAKANDEFHGTVAAAVQAGGVTVIPTGTPVLGRVVKAKPVGHFVGAAEITLELTTIRLPQPGGQGQDVAIVTEYLSSDGKGRGANTAEKAGVGAGGGAVIGALAGGGKGAAIGAGAGAGLGLAANALSSGDQIVIKPETMLRFQIQNPLTATVWVKDGRQIPLPAAPGPLLHNRPTGS
jgi:hypothetical protein